MHFSMCADDAADLFGDFSEDEKERGGHDSYTASASSGVGPPPAKTGNEEGPNQDSDISRVSPAIFMPSHSSVSNSCTSGSSTQTLNGSGLGNAAHFALDAHERVSTNDKIGWSTIPFPVNHKH